MKTLLLVAALFSAGCGVVGLQSVKGQKVYVDGVPADSVAAALTMWNTAVGTDLEISGDPRITSLTVAAVTEDCGGNHTGYDDDGSTTAAVCMGQFPDASDPLLVAVIAHEIGHIMGMIHIPQSTAALMNPGLSSASVITDADVAQFRARWGSL